MILVWDEKTKFDRTLIGKHYITFFVNNCFILEEVAFYNFILDKVDFYAKLHRNFKGPCNLTNCFDKVSKTFYVCRRGADIAIFVLDFSITQIDRVKD